MPTENTTVNLLKIWNLDFPSRIKFFLWRASRGCLPVLDRLRARGMQVALGCSGYDGQDESILHSLVWCPKAREVWIQGPFSSETMIDATSLPEWLNLTSESLDSAVIAQIRDLLYGIWSNRNNRVHGGRSSLHIWRRS